MGKFSLPCLITGGYKVVHRKRKYPRSTPFHPEALKPKSKHPKHHHYKERGFFPGKIRATVALVIVHLNEDLAIDLLYVWKNTPVFAIHQTTKNGGHRNRSQPPGTLLLGSTTATSGSQLIPQSWWPRRSPHESPFCVEPWEDMARVEPWETKRTSKSNQARNVILMAKPVDLGGTIFLETSHVFFFDLAVWSGVKFHPNLRLVFSREGSLVFENRHCREHENGDLIHCSCFASREVGALSPPNLPVLQCYSQFCLDNAWFEVYNRRGRNVPRSTTNMVRKGSESTSPLPPLFPK